MHFKNITKTNVIIIGAGISGLAAASTLAKAGLHDFKILEAQSYPGGRIKSQKFLEGNIELGAQWLHGTQSSFYEFARSRNLLTSTVSYEGQGDYLRKGGEKVSTELINEIRDVVNSILEDCETFYGETKSFIPDSVGKYLTSQFEKYLQSCNLDSQEIVKIKRELFDWHLRFQVIDNSCHSLDDLSAYHWGRFKSCGTENLNMKRNYSEIMANLINELPKKTNILYNKQVKLIEWNNNDIKVKYCAKGKQYEYLCDHVIITCSIGYLKENLHSLFLPPLPDFYTQAFQCIGFGTINKIFLGYEKPWWGDIKGIQLVWDSLPETLQIEGERDMKWTRGISGFDLVNGLPSVLLCWVGGIGAELVENLADHVVSQHCTQLLTVFSGFQVPLPTQIVRSKWNCNEYTRGSYSYIKAKSDTIDHSSTVDLLTPISKDINGKKVPAILFGGEALHKEHYSTVHGAYDTGFTQAQKLVDFLNL